MKKPPQKVAYLSRNSFISEIFLVLPNSANGRIHVPKCGLYIKKLYIELGIRQNNIFLSFASHLLLFTPFNQGQTYPFFRNYLPKTSIMGSNIPTVDPIFNNRKSSQMNISKALAALGFGGWNELESGK